MFLKQQLYEYHQPNVHFNRTTRRSIFDERNLGQSADELIYPESADGSTRDELVYLEFVDDSTCDEMASLESVDGGARDELAYLQSADGGARDELAYLQSADGGARDELAVVELEAAQVVATHQVVERRVGDERTVVEFEHDQRFAGKVRAAQVPDALVTDQLAV